MGTRPGRVKDRVAAFQTAFHQLLQQLAAAAVQDGDLADDEDPVALAFELKGIILAADSNFVLHDDPGALAIARKVVRRRLGVSA
jgi:hypothetical protein